jgi:hypothetical protein
MEKIIEIIFGFKKFKNLKKRKNKFLKYNGQF